VNGHLRYVPSDFGWLGLGLWRLLD
jgi:hypothetical protein